MAHETPLDLLDESLVADPHPADRIVQDMVSVWFPHRRVIVSDLGIRINPNERRRFRRLRVVVVDCSPDELSKLSELLRSVTCTCFPDGEKRQDIHTFYDHIDETSSVIGGVPT